MELDPLSVIANAALGWVLYYAGDYERAIAQCTRALELNPDFALAHLWRALAHEELGQYDALLSDFDHAVKLSGGSAIHVALRGRALAGAGRHEEALSLLQRLDQAGQRPVSGYVPPFEMAKLHERLGTWTPL
ncbi:MAG: tetratricopeptide repeat protein [Gemmatimonadetes bacterium]|nr:tetratricopeptide repeat protein [Gemmatimonadota bacterium]